MKNTVRTHLNGGKKSLNPQLKTPAIFETAKDDVISLALFSEKKGCSIGIVDFTHEEFQIIQNQIVRRKITVSDFLLETARKMTTNVPFLELEAAKMQANGLLQILSDTLTHQLESDCAFEGPAAQDVVTGATFLVQATKERLENAFNAVHAAICNPLKEVSA